MTTPAKIIKQLANTSSINEKKAILERNKSDDLFQRVLVAALNPGLNYFIKKIPTYSPAYTTAKVGVKSLRWAIDALKKLSSREKTGNEGIAYLVHILSSVDAEDAAVIEKIIGHDLRCGVGETLVNKVWKSLIPVYPCMLCSPYDDKLIAKMSWPAMAQLKSDGMRFVAEVEGGVVTFYSRNGKPIDLLGHLEKEFLAMSGKTDVVFDGELLVREKGTILPRKIGNGMLQRGIKDSMTEEIAKNVVTSVWDMIPLRDFRTTKYNVPYSQRFVSLSKAVKALGAGRVVIQEHTMVKNLDEAQKVFENYLSIGLEGIILKDMKSIWEDGRSRQQVKFKAEHEADRIIVGMELGDAGKRNANILGALVCETSDGIVQVNVGAGYNPDVEVRTDLWKRRKELIGTICTVMYNEKITDKKRPGKYSLFLPRFVELRLDKNEANSVNELK